MSTVRLFWSQLNTKENWKWGFFFTVMFVAISWLETAGRNGVPVSVIISLYFILAACFIFSLGFKQWRQNTFMNNNVTSRLVELGLEPEVVNGYEGYKGYYKGYFFRVFHSIDYWIYENSKKIVIVMYYRPIYNENGRIVTADRQNMAARNKQMYKQGFWYLTGSYVEVVSPYLFYYRFEFINRAMNAMVDMGEKENLVPLTEKEYDELLDIDVNYFCADVNPLLRHQVGEVIKRRKAEP